jgi:hypothetical protein
MQANLEKMIEQLTNDECSFELQFFNKRMAFDHIRDRYEMRNAVAKVTTYKKDGSFWFVVFGDSIEDAATKALHELEAASGTVARA